MHKVSAKKICIVVTSLGGGGAERSSALLSELLSELGYDIHIVSVLDKVDYTFKGQLLNLGKLKAENDTALGRIKRLFIFRNYIKNNRFDYVIDSRSKSGFLKEFIISRFIYNPKKTIYCVRSYNTNAYIHPNKVFANWLCKSAYRIVTVSQGVSDKLKNNYKFNNLEVIYNSLNEKLDVSKNEITKNESSILFYGRIDNAVKNISLLLSAYSKSILPVANVKLKILGDGKDRDFLVDETVKLNQQDNIEFLGFNPNPEALVKSSYFTVLTSRYEGFPRVLVESLALGTPVVSVDCKSGPNEIITNEYNGLLVENHNIEALAKAMNRMVNDKELYLHCKSNAKASVAHLSKEAIGKQWQALLK